MSKQRETKALIGVGATACAACCAAPIASALTAIGIGTAAGFALVGVMALVLGALALLALLWRRGRLTR